MTKEELKPIDVSKYTVTESGNVIKDTKDKLKQEAEEWVKEKNKEKGFGHFPIDCVEAYLAGAEPREKQIQIDAEQIRALQKQNGELTDKVKELEAQIEKLIDFVLSKTECCDVCPITDTCINSEGTCPYAGMLAKGEEEVTREWLMELISRR